MASSIRFVMAFQIEGQLQRQGSGCYLPLLNPSSFGFC